MGELKCVSPPQPFQCKREHAKITKHISTYLVNTYANRVAGWIKDRLKTKKTKKKYIYNV